MRSTFDLQSTFFTRHIPPIVHIELYRPSMAFPMQLYGECMVEIDFRLPWGEDYCS